MARILRWLVNTAYGWTILAIGVQVILGFCVRIGELLREDKEKAMLLGIAAYQVFVIGSRMVVAALGLCFGAGKARIRAGCLAIECVEPFFSMSWLSVLLLGTMFFEHRYYHRCGTGGLTRRKIFCSLVVPFVVGALALWYAATQHLAVIVPLSVPETRSGPWPYAALMVVLGLLAVVVRSQEVDMKPIIRGLGVVVSVVLITALWAVVQYLLAGLADTLTVSRAPRIVKGITFLVCVPAYLIGLRWSTGMLLGYHHGTVVEWVKEMWATLRVGVGYFLSRPSNDSA